MQANITKPKLRVVDQNSEQATPEAPKGVRDWTLAQIQSALSRQLPSSYLKQKTVGRGSRSAKVDFLPWYRAQKILDKYAPGWSWNVVSMEMSHDRLILVGRLTIPAKDGDFSREATGTENLKRINDDGDAVDIAYGDPSSNSEAMALRRAAARFGLGLYLYDKG